MVEFHPTLLALSAALAAGRDTPKQHARCRADLKARIRTWEKGTPATKQAAADLRAGCLACGRCRGV